jgi:hypothetical protein
MNLFLYWEYAERICLSGAYYRRKKNWRENEKTANIEKAVTFFLEEIEQKFKQIWKGI